MMTMCRVTRSRAYQTAAQQKEEQRRAARVHRVDIQNSTSCGESHFENMLLRWIAAGDADGERIQRRARSDATPHTLRTWMWTSL